MGGRARLLMLLFERLSELISGNCRLLGVIERSRNTMLGCPMLRRGDGVGFFWKVGRDITG